MIWRILGVGEAYRRYRRWMVRRLSKGGTFIFYFELSFVIHIIGTLSLSFLLSLLFYYLNYRLKLV